MQFAVVPMSLEEFIVYCGVTREEEREAGVSEYRRLLNMALLNKIQDSWCMLTKKIMLLVFVLPFWALSSLLWQSSQVHTIQPMEMNFCSL